jgi:8-oxo-dGTP pyrophosphatase MutT (NUDIX family)
MFEQQQAFPQFRLKHSNEYKQVKAFQSLSFKGKRGYSNVFLKGSLQQQNNQQNKTYGGIIQIKSPIAPTRYALVQGRYTGKWSFPKGHINEGETSAQCSFREIEEETGITSLPEPSQLFRIGYGNYYIFDIDSEIQLNPLDMNEIMDAKWVTLDEMDTLSLNADVSLFRKTLLLQND